MITCYVMTFISFLSMLIAFFQSFLNFHVFAANHVTFIIFTGLIYFATETLVIFFFVGTGVSIKEYTKDHQLLHTYHQKSISLKRKIYPPLMLNLLIMSIAFILVGAVDTHRIPAWIYQLVFLGGLLQYVDAKKIQHECFRENTYLILDMSGIKRPQVA